MKSLLALLWLFLAAIATAEERILSFHSRIEVLPSGALEVTETLRVDSEQNSIRHGIFRDFPQLYQGKWGLREKRAFEVTNVTRDGKPEPYTIESHEAGARVRIGSKDVLLPSATHTYTLTYRTDRQLLFFKDHDELYWNVTGNEWAFPILDASAEVILPDGITVTTIEGYIGPAGSKERADPKSVLIESGNRATLRAGRPLAPGEGFTLVATWPPRTLDPAAYQAAPNLLQDNPTVIAAACLLVAMLAWHFFAWVTVGRDPAPGLIIPQFAPPDDWSPAAVRMLDRMKFDNTCFSAAVLGLAAKKHLTIGGSEKRPSLQRTDAETAEPLSKEEAALFNRLFSDSTRSIELVQSNHRTIGAARTALEKSLRVWMEKTHFKNNVRYWLPGLLLTLAAVGLLLISAPLPPVAGFMTLWLTIWSLGTGALVSSIVTHARGGRWIAAIPLALFSLPFVGGWCVGVFFLYEAAGPLASSAFVFGIVFNVLFFHWIKAPTHLGRKMLDHIDGFRHYLSVAEEDRLSGFTCPQKTPELFEKFLPYAHALGVEQQWSARFAEVLKAAAVPDAQGHTNYRPTFYTGNHSGFTGAMAAAAIGGALTSALTTASTSPSSSGRGGGGSSGGGGGGGGGGGW